MNDSTTENRLPPPPNSFTPPGQLYTIPTIRPNHRSLALSPDEKYLYVTNTRSYDVTFVDAINATVLKNIGVTDALRHSVADLFPAKLTGFSHSLVPELMQMRNDLGLLTPCSRF